MSSSIAPRVRRWRGKRALELRYGASRLVVLPERGGKIASIVMAGREWLLQPRPGRLPDRVSGRYVDSELWGWDECAPTIDECVVDGRRVTSHGELWEQPWLSARGGLTAASRSSQFRLHRRIRFLTESRLRLDYSLDTFADDPVWVTWAAHGLFAAPPGTGFTLAGQDTALQETALEEIVRERRGRVSVRTAPPFRSSKHHSTAEHSVGACTLSVPGAVLRIRWDRSIAPSCGVWIDRRAYTGRDAIAIEPEFTAEDSLAAALSNGRAVRVDPARPVRWHLELST